MGQSILESQTKSSQQQSEKSFGRPGASTSGSMPTPPSGSSFSGGSDFSPKNMKEQIMSGREQKVELDINATPIDFLLLFVTGYLVIILALILPSVNIMRYQPKEILAGKE
jgi:hypothetical protein